MPWGVDVLARRVGNLFVRRSVVAAIEQNSAAVSTLGLTFRIDLLADRCRSRRRAEEENEAPFRRCRRGTTRLHREVNFCGIRGLAVVASVLLCSILRLQLEKHGYPSSNSRSTKVRVWRRRLINARDYSDRIAMQPGRSLASAARSEAL